jgi:hypothetical protein
MSKELTIQVQHKPDGTAMAKVNAYALALMATRESGIGLEVVQEAEWTSAESDDLAHEEGLMIARQKWPTSEGWSHQTAVRKVSMFIDLRKPETPQGH